MGNQMHRVCCCTSPGCGTCDATMEPLYLTLTHWDPDLDLGGGLADVLLYLGWDLVNYMGGWITNASPLKLTWMGYPYDGLAPPYRCCWYFSGPCGQVGPGHMPTEIIFDPYEIWPKDWYIMGPGQDHWELFATLFPGTDLGVEVMVLLDQPQTGVWTVRLSIECHLFSYNRYEGHEQPVACVDMPNESECRFYGYAYKDARYDLDELSPAEWCAAVRDWVCDVETYPWIWPAPGKTTTNVFEVTIECE